MDDSHGLEADEALALKVLLGEVNFQDAVLHPLDTAGLGPEAGTRDGVSLAAAAERKEDGN